MTSKSDSKTPLILTWLAGLIAGAAGWQLFTYLRGLMAQPRLSPLLLPQDLADHKTAEAKAFWIAMNNLRSGLAKRRLVENGEKVVLHAGVRNFREPWARDLSFASYGLMELGEYQAVRESLEAFFAFQLPSGQFPVKVHATRVIDRFLLSFLRREQPISAPLKPKYTTGHGTTALDGNALLTIAALHYVDCSEDNEFLDSYWPTLQRGMDWLALHAPGRSGLLFQDAFSDWADSIARQGNVLYTNVVYWKALHEMAKTARKNGLEEAERFAERSARVEAAIQQQFWREGVGFFITSQRFENLSSGGNLLAVAWGLAKPDQAERILGNMKRFGMADPIPTRPVYPAYPLHFVALENRLGRIGYYHTEAAWLWIGAWHVIAACQQGRYLEAEELLYRISSAIVRDGAVHEVYNPNGKPVSGLWYTAEAPLTWSAGMVVYAHRYYQRCLAAHQEAGDES